MAATSIVIDLNLLAPINNYELGISTDQFADESGGERLPVSRLLPLLSSVELIRGKHEMF
jgi:hypothetical protein